eukprot:scaffold769_cov278-Pavlova_lutheri.AAC.8
MEGKGGEGGFIADSCVCKEIEANDCTVAASFVPPIGRLGLSYLTTRNPPRLRSLRLGSKGPFRGGFTEPREIRPGCDPFASVRTALSGAVLQLGLE